MEKLNKITSVAAPLMLSNIDTDIIAPMKRILFNGDEIGKYAFEPIRFVNGDGDAQIPDPGFVLNQEPYAGAKILLCGENFGCGSSRENAPEGIADMGIRCVIGTSFGGIFFKNCVNQGILSIRLSREQVDRILEFSRQGQAITVDLEQKEILLPEGTAIPFEIPESQRNLLMEGLDNVGLTLKKSNRIRAFEEADRKARPWVYEPIQE